MRIAILGDVHGNLEALSAVVGAARNDGVDEWVQVGDLVGYGPEPSECIDVVRDLGCVVCMGNHDAAVAGLTDAQLDTPYRPDGWTVRQLVHHMDSYERIHQVRARRSGPNIYVEIFLEFNPTDLMGDVQKRIDALRKDLQANHAGMDISIRPTAAIAD